jgi:AAA family ATP:ADP antiporter
MKQVFVDGTEKEILFMLSKTREINDPRFNESINNLLKHPSDVVKAEALRNLFFLNDSSINLEVIALLKSKNPEIILAALQYLLLHSNKNESIVFDSYLNHKDALIADAALLCLAIECRNNYSLKHKYQFNQRLTEKANQLQNIEGAEKEEALAKLIAIIGHADYKEGYPFIHEGLLHQNEAMVFIAIEAAGNSLSPVFVESLLELLEVKKYRNAATEALLYYGYEMIVVLKGKITDRETNINLKRLIPQVLSKFQDQRAVSCIFSILNTSDDLSVRLECIRALTNLKTENPSFRFDKNQVAKFILEECKLYDKTLNAMHTQIIVQYLKRKKGKQLISVKEIDARDSLMELLERRLDAGLERIFKLLELQYNQLDVKIAYQGILSEEQEKRTNAIEFLDNILNINIKNVLIPIVESAILNTSSEEVIEMISKNRYTEYSCFETILKGKDLKLKLAVLYLIEQMGDAKYLMLIEPLLKSEDKKIQSFANNVYKAITN